MCSEYGGNASLVLRECESTSGTRALWQAFLFADSVRSSQNRPILSMRPRLDNCSRKCSKGSIYSRARRSRFWISRQQASNSDMIQKKSTQSSGKKKNARESHMRHKRPNSLFVRIPKLANWNLFSSSVNISLCTELGTNFVRVCNGILEIVSETEQAVKKTV